MTGAEAKQRLKKQYDRQNEFVREKYDRQSVTFPKGTKARLESYKAATGEKANTLINRLVLGYLDEYEQMQTAPEPQTQEPKPEEPEEPKAQGISHFWEENEELPF